MGKFIAGVLIHDGNIGADVVNITRGGQVVAMVPYQPDGSQRDIAARFVSTWNAFDAIAAENEAVSIVSRQLETSSRKRGQINELLKAELRNLCEDAAKKMSEHDAAALRAHVDKLFITIEVLS